MTTPIPPRCRIAVAHRLDAVHHGFDLTLRVRALDGPTQGEALEAALAHVAALALAAGLDPLRVLRERKPLWSS